MPDSTAAIWSAVAASASALSSFLIWRIHRRNLLESVRPELVLTDWDRYRAGQGDAVHDVIWFQTIKNVGRGPALHVYVNAYHEVADHPTVVLSTIRLPILAPGEATTVKGEIMVWWENVESPASEGKSLPVRVTIFCWDSRGMRHETRYNLFAIESSPHVGIVDEIAPGVMLGKRTTTTRPVWLLKLVARVRRAYRYLIRSWIKSLTRITARLERVPGLRRWFRDKVT